MQWSRSGLRRLKGHRVIVTTLDDRSFDGVLVGVWADLLELADVTYLEGEGSRLNGSIGVPRSNYAFHQVKV